MISQLEAISLLSDIILDNEIDEEVLSPLLSLEDFQASIPDGYRIISDERDLESFSDFSKVEESAFDSRYIEQDIDTIDSDCGLAYYYDSGLSDPYVLDLMGNPKLAKQYRYDMLVSYLEEIENMQDLNACMSQINECLVKQSKRNRLYKEKTYLLNKGDIDKLRDLYKVCRDKMPRGCDFNAYFTVCGDNPIIHDQSWTWDHCFESEGGWSRLDPTTEEDFRQRNDIEWLDSKLMRQAEIKTIEINGKIYTKYFVSQEVYDKASERKERFERISKWIDTLSCPKKISKARSDINQGYFKSRDECTKINDFTGIILTKEQKDSLNQQCDIKRKQLLERK